MHNQKLSHPLAEHLGYKLFETILAETDVLSWVGPVVQLVQLGGFGALVWFFFLVRMPQMEKNHLDERKEWLAYMHKRDEKFETILERCVKTIEESNGNARRG